MKHPQPVAGKVCIYSTLSELALANAAWRMRWMMLLGLTSKACRAAVSAFCALVASACAKSRQSATRRGSRNRLGDGLAVRVLGHGRQPVCLTHTGQADPAVHHLYPAAILCRPDGGDVSMLRS